MKKVEAKRRIAQLRKEIQHHRYLYHVLNQQDISDAALDSLKKELFDLEQQYPDLITPDSPTQRVAGEPIEGFDKVEHSSRMLSLNDAFNTEDMEAWIERMRRVEPNGEYGLYVEPKIDGLAIALIYVDGVLQTAATRGNGFVGENVTTNIKTIQSVPLRLQQVKGAPKTVEVRGEVYMTKEVFDRINAEREKAGEPTYMNPRNTAAGSIRQLDPQLVADRQLQFLAYSLVTDLGQKTHADERGLLADLGFVVNPMGEEVQDVAGVMRYQERLEKKRDAVAFQLDGVVARVNSNAMHERLGVVGKAPRGAIALKFAAEQATTIVEDIQVQIGRTGALTPVAHLKPVEVDGSTVQRATLHNMDEIKRLGVKIGDTVIIEKAGDIIPDIVEVLPNLRTGKEKAFRMPKRCPVCGSPVERREGEVAHYCTNTQCFGQQKEGFYHFVSKKGFEIEGLGPKIIDQLLDAGLIATPADLFELKAADLESLERFAETSAANTEQAIQSAKTVELHRLIFALGIRHVGEQTAVVLADTFGSFDAFRSATPQQIEAIHDIGASASQSISDYFADKGNQEMLDKLIPQLDIQNPDAMHLSDKLEGKSFLFTGSLESMTRDDAKKRVRENGGEAASSVTKKLDYLVAGEKAGSKLEKAKKLGVQVITEKDFLKMIG